MDNRFVLYTSFVAGVVVPLNSYMDKSLSKDPQFYKVDATFGDAGEAEWFHYDRYNAPSYVLSGENPANEVRQRNPNGGCDFRWFAAPQVNKRMENEIPYSSVEAQPQIA